MNTYSKLNGQWCIRAALSGGSHIRTSALKRLHPVYPATVPPTPPASVDPKVGAWIIANVGGKRDMTIVQVIDLGIQALNDHEAWIKAKSPHLSPEMLATNSVGFSAGYRAAISMMKLINFGPRTAIPGPGRPLRLCLSVYPSRIDQ